MCDTECNSRACNYDDGDCTVPVAAKNAGSQRFAQISHVNISMNEGIQLVERHAFLLEKLHFQSKFRSPSVLATAADSQVLRSIHHLRRSSIRESILSNDAQNSRFRTSGIDSVQDPSAVKCVSSSFLVKNTYIEPDPRNFATQGQLCLGLTTCTSCDACSVCSSAGCDSSCVPMHFMSTHFYFLKLMAPIGTPMRCAGRSSDCHRDASCCSRLQPKIFQSSIATA